MADLQLGERGLGVDGMTVITPERELQNVTADAEIIASGEIDVARIPDLPAGKITSEELDIARIPDLPAEKITSGTLPLEIFPGLPAEILITGELDNGRVTENNVKQHQAALEIGPYQISETIPISKGGTGLTALGTALQSLRVNAGQTELEYYTPIFGREDWELLSSHIQTGSATSAVDFSGLSSTYRAFRIIARIVRATNNPIGLRLNNDDGNNYDSLNVYVQTNGSAVAYDNPGALSAWNLGSSSTEDGSFWYGDILVMKPTTGLVGAVRADIMRYGGTVGNRSSMLAGSWDNTTELINQITLGIFANTIGLGSSVRLYGYRNVT